MSKKTKAAPATVAKATPTRPALNSAPERPSRGGRSSSAKSGVRRPQDDWQVKHPHAAGIDIGTREHWVAVNRGGTEPSTRCFGTCTPDLDEMIVWLREREIEDVAMESTGMYWLPVYERLDEAGFRVILADSRQTKNTSGRKSDLLDCEWIGQLHTYGLLRAAFRPKDEICRLRTIQRHRKTLVESSSRSVQHIQKALDGMNLHVHHALSNLMGASGEAMLEAILRGEREPRTLAALADRRVKQSPQKLEAALTGNYREEELFVLGQAMATYRHYQAQIAECDQKIMVELEALSALCPPEPAPTAPEVAASKAKQGAETPKAKQNSEDNKPKAKRLPPRERPLAALLLRLFGVDLTAIPGLGVLGVLTLLSEIGSDMSRWANAKAFASWLGLSPNHRISGGRLLSASSRKVVNRAAVVFRVAAMAAGKTDTPLGVFYRRKAAQFGAPKAITATARKMACLVYEMVSKAQPYRAEDASGYQKRYDAQRLKALRKRVKNLGFDLVELKEAA